MGLKYYLNLFKKDSNNEVVKLRYFFNFFVFLVYMVFFGVFYSLRKTDVIMSSAFGFLALAGIIFQRFLHRSFERLIERLIKEETLDEGAEVDSAFIAYRKGYIEFKEKNKATERKLFPLEIISTLMLIAFLPVPIIINLMGNIELADKVHSIAVIVMLAFFGLVVLASFIFSKKDLWYQSYMDELMIINKFKAPESGGVKYKFIEDKKPNKQFEYLFPQKEYLKRHKSYTKFFLIVIIVFLALSIAAMIALPVIVSKYLDNGDLAVQLIGWVFLGDVIVMLSLAVLVTVLQSRNIKKQYRELKSNPDENALYIKLHELRTPFIKRWNILFVVCTLGAIVSNVIFALVTSAVLKTDDYGGYFLLAFFVEFIATYVLYFKSFGRVRLKMMEIENEIDTI